MDAEVTPKSKKYLIGLGLIVLMLAIIGGVDVLFLHGRLNGSPVPEQISKSLSFPVYYPDRGKLPAGYSLDTNSFRKPADASNVLLYTIKSSKNALFISLQSKPSESELRTFNSQRIPLHTPYQTPFGEAEIGAIGDHSITSLPTKDGTWIIVTAPYAINDHELKQVLNSFTKG